MYLPITSLARSSNAASQTANPTPFVSSSNMHEPISHPAQPNGLSMEPKVNNVTLPEGADFAKCRYSRKGHSCAQSATFWLEQSVDSLVRSCRLVSLRVCTFSSSSTSCSRSLLLSTLSSSSSDELGAVETVAELLDLCNAETLRNPKSTSLPGFDSAVRPIICIPEQQFSKME